MNKLVRGVVTGSVIGATVGAVMLLQNRNKQKLMRMSFRRSRQFGHRAGNTWRTVRDQAMQWTSNVRHGTGMLSKNLIRRMH